MMTGKLTAQKRRRNIYFHGGKIKGGTRRELKCEGEKARITRGEEEAH